MNLHELVSNFKSTFRRTCSCRISKRQSIQPRENSSVSRSEQSRNKCCSTEIEWNFGICCYIAMGIMFTFLLIGSLVFFQFANSEMQRQPHLILIVADDLGKMLYLYDNCPSYFEYTSRKNN